MDEKDKIKGEHQAQEFSPLNTQVGGNHYKQFAIQPTEFIYKNNIPFLEGNVIECVSRHRQKNGLQDLLEAKHYIDMIIAFEYMDKSKEND